MTNGFSILISSAVIMHFGCCSIGRIQFIIASFIYTLPPAIVHDAFSIDLRFPTHWWSTLTFATDHHLLDWKLPWACLSWTSANHIVSHLQKTMFHGAPTMRDSEFSSEFHETCKCKRISVQACLVISPTKRKQKVVRPSSQTPDGNPSGKWEPMWFRRLRGHALTAVLRVPTAVARPDGGCCNGSPGISLGDAHAGTAAGIAMRTQAPLGERAGVLWLQQRCTAVCPPAWG